MAISDYSTTNSSTWTITDYDTTSGTMRWYETDPYRGAHLDTKVDVNLNYIPEEFEDEIEPIQGDPDGARYLISYAFKDDNDPVVFLKNKKDMMEMLKRLMEDEAVDHDTILIHRISSQFKPKVSWLKKIVKVKDIELKKVDKKRKK